MEARKARLAAQWEQAATEAVDQLNDHLDASTLPPNALVPVAGVATDKLLALSGDPALTQTQQNLHLHLQSYDVARQFNARCATMKERIRNWRSPGAVCLTILEYRSSRVISCDGRGKRKKDYAC